MTRLFWRGIALVDLCEGYGRLGLEAEAPAALTALQCCLVVNDPNCGFRRRLHKDLDNHAQAVPP
jgi:hypothetical protein